MSFIAELANKQIPGYSLDQPFYTDKAIYRHDIERIFMADWLYICHVSQLQGSGDCFTYNIDTESVIVLRDEDLNLKAFVNVCRHRGSRICEPGKSNHKRLVCPYHAWTYGLDGKLLAARQMGAEFNKSKIALKELRLELFNGFIFVSFADNPPSFEMLRLHLSPPLDVFNLEQTKVVHHAVHPIQANWKLVFENFSECYHCGPAHKEFSASHSLMLDKQRQLEFDQQIAKRAPKAGISPQTVCITQAAREMNHHATYYYDRYALFKGYLTGSEDGQPVAPLLGKVKEYDAGASNVQLGNLTHLLIYADHVVLYRFTPRSVRLTDAEVIWLVRSDADDDKDHDTGRMTWLWNVTTVADREIIERNQQGVESRFYKPGPYAPMENFTVEVIKWYLRAIA